MQLKPRSIWWPRIATFLLWVAAAASLAFWGLKWSGMGAKPPGVPSAGAGDPAPVDPQAMARLLGAGSLAAPAMAAPGAASRYTLMGVVAGPHGAGVALISVDGKPARPVEVGAPVDELLILVSVAARQAALSASANAPASVTLELPPLKRSAPLSPSQPSPAAPPGQVPKPNPFEAFQQKPSPT